MLSLKSALSILLVAIFPVIGRSESALQNCDIGQVGVEGGASFQNGNLRVKGSGEGMQVTGDSFHYVWEARRGECEIVAKILPLGASQGALVMRDGQESTTPGIWLGFDPKGKIIFTSRVSKNGLLNRLEFDANGSDPIWLKIVRVENKFNLAYSEDGVSWETFHRVTISLPNLALAGFAVSGTDAEVVFEGTHIAEIQSTDSETLAVGGGAASINIAEADKRQNDDPGASSGGDPHVDVLPSKDEADPSTRKRKIYVNKVLGDDENDGAASLRSGNVGPMRTIQAAFKLAKDGDEIVVAPGTYTVSELNPIGEITITPVGDVILESEKSK